MAQYNTPKRGVAYKFYIGLVDQSNTKVLKANPTIASGDFKVSKDGGAFANLTTLPSANPASGVAVMVDLSATEMTADNIVVSCIDAAGAEWCDQLINIQPTVRQLDDLAYPATSGRSIGVDANGNVSLNSAIKKNTAFANFGFVMTDSTNHNPATGKTVTITRRIDNGSFGSGTLSAVTEVSNGLYRVDLGAGDLNGACITLRMTATGCDDLMIDIYPEP